ncbi:hypothetical protein E3P81_00118 [Wallemia ichthyophaga]|nr:hypothetical protein E3P97_00049 [Wallemia ichthyophaga]TIB36191.1 hypothetical protein E3P85_00119 [Wallemia ichthyophaga]TIB51498.1 hypothetical protein E3P82_00049 [Wallemia ichthyophaga]TIB54768.1 hypothetical protein E3P81_00118 [Wallemia ichthyophaga]TIB57281.1 hypothetical protein E3P80_00049 [Wallemia ichthyophaga]
MSAYTNLKADMPLRSVQLISLHRPNALNALNRHLMAELDDVLQKAQSDSQIKCVVLTGSEKAFAAGADIKEMKDISFVDAYKQDFLSSWNKIREFRKPLIGAVSGYALGGGFEVAMATDILLASNSAKFGQPEINLGIIPGGGGTQRLIRAVGKAKAMEMILTGRMIKAQEACERGLVSQVLDAEQLMPEALKVAEEIANKSAISVQAAKEAVNAAHEMPLSEGLRFERRLFHQLFATKDQKEGMLQPQKALLADISSLVTMIKFEIWSYPGGPNPFKVLNFLEELGFTHRADYIIHNLEFGDHPQRGVKGEFFLRINPNGRVPALVDHRNNHLVVWESGAILQYLARRYGQEQYMGKDLNEQAAVTQWLDFQISGHGPIQGQVNYFKHFWKSVTGEDPPPLVIKRYENECYRVFSVLEGQSIRQKAAGSDFIALDRYTVADISFHGWLRLTNVAQLSFEQFPLVQAWVERMEKRPSTQRAALAQASQVAARRPAIALQDNVASLHNSKAENAFNIASTYFRIENDMILNQVHKIHPIKGYRFYNRCFSIVEFSVALASLITLSTNRPQILTLLPLYAYWVYLGFIALESSFTSNFNFERLVLGSLYLVINAIIYGFRTSFPSNIREYLILAFAVTYILPSIFLPYQTDNVSTKAQGGPKTPAALEEPTSVLSRISFFYIDPYIFKHFRIPVNHQSQIPSLRSDNLTSYILLKFRSLSSTPPTVTNFVPRLFKCFRRDLGYMVVMSAFKSVCTLSAPFCLQRILKHISSRGDGTRDHEAFLFAFLLFVGQVAGSLFNQQALLIGRKLCINLRSTLISEVFLKSLRRKYSQGEKKSEKEDESTEESESKEESSSSSNEGRIINLVSVDAFKTSEISAYLHFVFPECPLTIVLAITGLYQLLGKSALVGISVLLLTIPLTYFVNRIFIKIQTELLQKIDARLDLATEVLSNIHLVKLNAWEDRLIEKMNITRAKELSVLKKRFAAWILNGILMWGTPIAVTVCTFMAHTKLFGQVLISQEAFTALLLFRFPLEVLPEVIVHVLQAKISCERIAEYINNEADTSKYQQLSGPKDIGDPTIGFKNATLVYEGDGSQGFALRKFNLDFPVSKFSVVAGPVGSGKTSLLDSLLGELSLIDGRVFMPCSMNADEVVTDERTGLKDAVAYAPQAPFLLSTTIKENILFGSPFNKNRYDKVLKACALLPDLALFDDGDETEVGEKGTTCSGGQKARIALARAIYSSAKHVLLDDVLSAVDSQTGQNLLKNALLGPLMRNRTVILVTHHVAMCAAKASYVVFLRDGLVDGAGTPVELQKQGLLDVSHDEIEQNPPEEPKANEAHDKRLETVQGGHHLISNNIMVEGYATPTLDKRSHSIADGEEAPESDNIAPKKTRIEEEKKSEGAVSAKVYKLYAASLGGGIFWSIMFFTFIGAQTSEVAASYWLRLWTSSYDKAADVFSYIVTRTSMLFVPGDDIAAASLINTHDETNYYLAIYVLVSFGYIVLTSLCMFVMFNASVNASRKLYDRMLTRVMKTRSRFFDSTPTGRIMNRMSKDIEVVDQETAPVVLWFLHSLVLALFILLVITFAAPAFIFGAIIVAIVYYLIGALYLQTSRDVKRIESLTRSPIFSTFFECLNGVVSIRAYAATNRFQNRVFELLDENNAGFLMLWYTNRWLSLRIDVAAAMISLTTAIFLLLDKSISPSMAGFALSYAITFNEAALWVVRLSAQTEINLNSVERIGEYLDLEPEQKEDEGEIPGPEWPSENSYIDIRSLSVRYSPELRRVLDNVSFVVKPGEKVGICGRTGSGKSTLVLCLNRILELESGLISIDGNDISELKLEALRSRMTTIPQEAQLFGGTLRENLDPFDEFTDDEIWEVLKRVKLASSMDLSVTSLSESANIDRTSIKSLNEKVAQSGKNFSAGQRQLLALARGLLKLSHAKSNILLLDESTANLDSHSDEIIQRALRYDMDNVTILCVAHRLRTIADYDKILVLDAGRVVEYDTPANLYKKNSNFTSLCKQSGEDAELAKIIFEKEERK